MSDETNLPAVKAPQELSVDDVKAQLRKILVLMEQAMHKGEDYGVIPGTERKDRNGKDISKPTLLKPGAEKILLMFRIDPQYETTETRGPGDHLSIQSRCVLYHLVSGNRLGSGMGSCSTLESKYRWRSAARLCPECEKPAIRKGAARFGGGWYCAENQGGCKAKFEADDDRIVGQETGRVENTDLADQWNTVLKMSNKRALIAAVLNVTGASQLFTQDVADRDEDGGDEAAVGDGGRRKASSGRGAQSPPPARPGPDDLASDAQVNALWRSIRSKMDEAAANKWWLEAGAAAGCTSRATLTVGQLQAMTQKSTELGNPAPEQQPDAPPAGMEEERDIEY